MTEPHNEFFIEKETLPVDVVLVTGEELRGSMFIQQSWRKPSIEYDAPALLQHPDSYFPLQLPDGTTRLIAKAHVVLMRGNISEDNDQMGDPAPVVVRCSNGGVVHGNLMIMRVTANVRVLDYLNRSAEEFILLHQGNRAVLINCRHVVLVQDESNGAA